MFGGLRMQYLRWSRVALLPTLGFAFFLSLLPAVAAAQEERPDGQWQKRLVADYDQGSKFLPAPYAYAAEQIPYEKLTHIIHAGVPFDDDGNLQVPDGF